MLPADTIAEITTNLVALNLQPKAWSGQSLREVERYTKAADQKRLALNALARAATASAPPQR